MFKFKQREGTHICLQTRCKEVFFGAHQQWENANLVHTGLERPYDCYRLPKSTIPEFHHEIPQTLKPLCPSRTLSTVCSPRLGYCLLLVVCDDDCIRTSYEYYQES